MLTGAVNRLRGQVRVRVESPFPERVLNLCGARGVAVWDLEWESAAAFTCRIARRDLNTLRRGAEPLDCALTVLRREGAPDFLLRFRRRQALLIGLVACGLALVVGSFFVWDFEIEGNDTVPAERILRALEHQGVGLGSFGLSLDGEDLRNHVLLEVPELSWIAVNVSGFRAHVQVRERIAPPELVDETAVCNLVARRAGLVQEVRALDGVAAVLPGTSVTEGQLLISGVEDLETLGARTLAGLGSVKARTWYALTVSVPLSVPEKQRTGSKTGVSLIFGTHRVKFFSNSSIAGTKYDKITGSHQLSLLGIRLPLRLETERWQFYSTASVPVDAARAQALGEQILQERLVTLVEPYGTVRSTLCSTRSRGGVLDVTLTAECMEEIGQRVPVLTEWTEEPGGDPESTGVK